MEAIMKFRSIVIYALVAVFLAGVLLQAQSALEIRAASSAAVPGWQQMSGPGGDTLWVSPDNALTSADIAGGEARTQPDGQRVVAVVFTSDGARKMAQLSTAQIGKPVVVLLDGKIVAAPLVRSRIDNEATISGTTDTVERVLLLLKK
jgi:preprotein translocase subunit SecD